MSRWLRVLIATCCLSFAANAAHAGGINLSWDDCGTYGNMTKSFACNTNTGARGIIGSAIAPVPMPQFEAMSAAILLITDQPTLPPWWNFDTGCRSGSPIALGPSWDFTQSTFNCHDVWNGDAAGGLNYQSGYGGANLARLRLVCAVAVPRPIDASTEYYLFRANITNAKTTGAGSCGGCDAGMCLALQYIQLVQPVGVGDYVVTNPANRNFVAWQTGAAVAGGCPNAVPVRNTTWGAVKSLYR